MRWLALLGTAVTLAVSLHRVHRLLRTARRDPGRAATPASMRRPTTPMRHAIAGPGADGQSPAGLPSDDWIVPRAVDQPFNIQYYLGHRRHLAAARAADDRSVSFLAFIA